MYEARWATSAGSVELAPAVVNGLYTTKRGERPHSSCGPVSLPPVPQCNSSRQTSWPSYD